MVHRSEKKEISHDRVEKYLEEHAVADHRKHEVKRRDPTVLWEEQLLVVPVHTNHGYQKGSVSDDIVDLSMQMIKVS